MQNRLEFKFWFYIITFDADRSKRPTLMAMFITWKMDKSAERSRVGKLAVQGDMGYFLGTICRIDLRTWFGTRVYSRFALVEAKEVQTQTI